MNKKEKAKDAKVSGFQHPARQNHYCDQLFTIKIKELIKNTNCHDLILKIDGSLVQVPWELLHIGGNFLCQRFSMGRMVSTRQPTTNHITRKYQKPLKMLILADPRGDLNAAYEEGMIIGEKFADRYRDLKINLKTTFIRTESIKRSLREYDIIHYAGHAEYELKDPAHSGWRTADGLLSTSDIINMRGGDPLPLLIFSNSCQSGEKEPWSLIASGERGVYGLANAFLLSGVQHYIGTFWNIPDRAGLRLAVAFYQNLLNGMSIGKSLRDARDYLIKMHGEDNTTWMAYMLYGDPTFGYFGKDAFKKVISDFKETDSQEKGRPCIEPVGPLEEEATRFRRHAMDADGIKPFSIRRPFSRVNHHLKIVLSLFLLVAMLIGITRVLRNLKPESHIPLSENAPFSDKERNERIRELIKELGAKGQVEKRGELFDIEDDWTSRPITVAVFGYLSEGNAGLRNDIKLQQVNELIARNIDIAIKTQGSIPIVDRRHLEEILLEHQLSLSDLAHNKQLLVKFGKIFGARVFLFSELLPQPYDNKYEIDINIIDTETTKKIPFMYPLDKERDYKSAAREIAKMAINKIGEFYSLKEIKGRITSVAEINQVKLNIGSLVGLRSGHIMDVRGEGDRKEPGVIGRIEVLEVDAYSALAKVLEEKRPIKTGDRVFLHL